MHLIYGKFICYDITVKLLHSSLILIIRVSVEKALDGSRRYSMTAQLISLFQHFLNIILCMVMIIYDLISVGLSFISLLTHLCCSLAWVFFMRSSSTTMDCFWGSGKLMIKLWRLPDRYNFSYQQLSHSSGNHSWGRRSWKKYPLYFICIFSLLTYLEITDRSDFNISLVERPFLAATALFLMYCFPMIWTITLPLLR